MTESKGQARSGEQGLTDEQLGEIRERDSLAKRAESQTRMVGDYYFERQMRFKHAADIDRRALLSHIAALMAQAEEMGKALTMARPLVELVFARNPGQRIHGETLVQIDAALAVYRERTK